MILAVDIGNSRLKWSARAPGAARGGAFAWREVDLDAALAREWAALEAPARVVVANVAGEEPIGRVRAWSRARWQLEPERLETQAAGFGVRNGYRDHRQLGVDRWLALIAAWARVGGPLCVVDCGTATTVDALDAEGRHLGGLIAPGVGLMRRALAGNTAALGRAGEGALEWPARDTAAAIATGSVNAVAGGIERALRRLCADAPAAHCLVTGGEAPLVLGELGPGYEHVPDLVLQGIHVAAGEPW